MKKIFTLLMFSFCCMWGMAQSLSFTYNGKTVENGSTVISDKSEKVELPPLGTNVRFNPEICLKVDQTAEVVVALESLDKDLQFCAVDDKCIIVNPGSSAQKTGTFKGGKESDLQIHYDPGFLQDPSNLTAHAIVSAWYKGDESSKISINLVMSNDPEVLSVEDVKVGNSKVAYDGHNLVYAFNNDEARQLVVYTLDGRKVLEMPVVGKEGKITLSSLTDGIYVYSIAGQSGVEKGKIWVK
jgi:hypothetical protein